MVKENLEQRLKNMLVYPKEYNTIKHIILHLYNEQGGGMVRGCV
jgi:hypothetical protein